MLEKILDQYNIPEITGITCDSRKVKPGYAFIAITGFNLDGNIFIEEAVEKGANIIFTEQQLNSNYSVPVIKVEDSRALLGELAAEYYDYPSNSLKLIGVTGTNGKTTTTHLIYNLLNAEKKQAGIIGTVNIDTGSGIRQGELTTPPAVELQKYLKTMVNSGLKYACMEVSSHGIKLKRIAGTLFSIKVGTNISLDHFDLHQGFPDYVEVKKEFLSSNHNNLVLINQDDKYIGQGKKIAANQLNYGIKSPAEIKAEEINTRSHGIHFNYQLKRPLKTDRGKILRPIKFPLKINLPGEHNIYNTLVAVTVALYYDISPEKIQKFFKTFPGVWRRLQLVYENSFTIIDDCAHNPGSYEAVFRAVRQLRYNKVLIVNSLRGNRGCRINRENAEIFGTLLPHLGDYHLFTSNCNDVAKPVDRVTPGEEKAFLETLKKHNINFNHFKELKPTLEAVLNESTEGSLILLLGPHAMDTAAEMILGLIQ